MERKERQGFRNIHEWADNGPAWRGLERDQERDEVERIYMRYLDEGLRFGQLAASEHVAPQTLQGLFIRHGFPTRPRGRPKKPWVEKTRQEKGNAVAVLVKPPPQPTVDLAVEPPPHERFRILHWQRRCPVCLRRFVHNRGVRRVVFYLRMVKGKPKVVAYCAEKPLFSVYHRDHGPGFWSQPVLNCFQDGRYRDRHEENLRRRPINRSHRWFRMCAREQVADAREEYVARKVFCPTCQNEIETGTVVRELEFDFGDGLWRPVTFHFDCAEAMLMDEQLFHTVRERVTRDKEFFDHITELVLRYPQRRPRRGE